MSNVYAVIMAGGRGERFWPLSTDTVPKPFIPLTGAKTLLQEAVDRLQPLIPIERVFISIGQTHHAVARAQLPQIPDQNFIVEPVGRDTSACLGYCALHLEMSNPEATMLALPADHYVGDPAAYRQTLAKGIEALGAATAVVFGILPTRPETGYGYILSGEAEAGAESRAVLKFVEKPSATKAAEYLKSGDYFWNSGMFLWRNRTVLELFSRHMPETYKDLERLRPLIRHKRPASEILAIFSQLQRISIDYGILEKATGLRLVPASFAWDDIGNWASLERILPHDPNGNVTQGNNVAVESVGCVIYSDLGTVAAFGVSNLIIVQAHGKVLVCPKERASELKQLVSALSAEQDRRS